jgi:hypothetical protein
MKAPDETWAQVFYEKTTAQIFQFLERKTNLAHKELEETAGKRSDEALQIIRKNYRGNLH